MNQPANDHNLAQSPKRKGRLPYPALGALVLFAPLLLGAKGCEVAELGSDDASCGVRGSSECESGEFCLFDVDAACGAADQLGTCTALPAVCPSVDDPVCGCDDVSYSNECEANAKGISVAEYRACEVEVPQGSACGGERNAACERGEYCHYPSSANCGAADQTGTCERIPDDCPDDESPVCGCDGITYGNACKAHAADTSVANEGPCEPPPSDGICGGLAGQSCQRGEFCNYPEGALCGAADQTGTCEPIPEVCTDDWAPVCGCDDVSYGNACEAHAAGISVASEGECQDGSPRTCGGLLGQTCPSGEYCAYPLEAMCGAADGQGTCEPIPEGCPEYEELVCGCDDATYGNPCMAAAAGTSVQLAGPCEEPPTRDVCGGLAEGDAASCNDDQFCNYAPEAACGAADQTGTCQDIPEGCTDDWTPVCGCDGKTHSNACEAHAARTSVASEGECESDLRTCGGIAGLACEEGEFCDYASPDMNCTIVADAAGVCRVRPEACDAVFDPVCGCDGDTYSNACVANSAGVSVASEGECE